MKPQLTDVVRGLDEHWNALDEPRTASIVVLEVDVSAANEDVDACVLDPMRDGHDRCHCEWRDVVSDSYDPSFHPQERRHIEPPVSG